MENNIKITGSVKVNGASFKGAVNVGNNIDGCVAERGVAGFSPIANVVANGDDVTITITDYKGTTTATIPDMADEVERIEALIPNTASPTNKLVDTATLDSSVQTATSKYAIKSEVDTELANKANLSLSNINQEGQDKFDAKVNVDDMVEINIGLTLGLFDTILKDHILTYEESQGLALQGTYVYKEALAGSRYGYPDFYAKCLEEYNQTTTTETVNGATVRVHPNGHKFYNISDKTAIDEFFNTMGSAWFYGIDTANERIFLPRDKYFAISGVAPVVGNNMSLGLTNGTYDFALQVNTAQNNGSGNDRTGYGKAVGFIGSATDNDKVFSPIGSLIGVTSDPTKSGIEAHLTANEDKYLYICVGNITNYEGVTDVVNQGMEILEQVNQGIESRVAKDSMEEVTCVVETYVNGTSWYRVWSDGYCEQGGVTASVSAGASIVTNYLKNFINTNYTLLTQGLGEYTNNQEANNIVSDKQASHFTLYSGYHGAKTFSWYASGYIN